MCHCVLKYCVVCFLKGILSVTTISHNQPRNQFINIVELFLGNDIIDFQIQRESCLEQLKAMMEHPLSMPMRLIYCNKYYDSEVYPCNCEKNQNVLYVRYILE